MHAKAEFRSGGYGRSAPRLALTGNMLHVEHHRLAIFLAAAVTLQWRDVKLNRLAARRASRTTRLPRHYALIVYITLRFFAHLIHHTQTLRFQSIA